MIRCRLRSWWCSISRCLPLRIIHDQIEGRGEILAGAEGSSLLKMSTKSRQRLRILEMVPQIVLEMEPEMVLQIVRMVSQLVSMMVRMVLQLVPQMVPEMEPEMVRMVLQLVRVPIFLGELKFISNNFQANQTSKKFSTRICNFSNIFRNHVGHSKSHSRASSDNQQ